MRRQLLAVLVCGLLGLPAHAGAQATIDRVAWMQGCWQMTSGDRVVEEQWTAPRAGSMLGAGRTTKGTSLVEHEFILLVERAGRLAYEAHPSGQATTTFLSTTVDEGSVVFEDPAHDFPQRVGYRRVSAEQMTAWIEGTMSGKARRVEFPYRRVACS
jgi:hypothetical protein